MEAAVYRISIWLGTTSVMAFAAFGWDKALAKLKRRRVPEAALLGCALLGGGAGATLGMIVLRHKIRKPLFRRLVPLSLCAQTALLAWAVWGM